MRETKPLYRLTHTFPNGEKSVFLVERGVWERFEAWRVAETRWRPAAEDTTKERRADGKRSKDRGSVR